MVGMSQPRALTFFLSPPAATAADQKHFVNSRCFSPLSPPRYDLWPVAIRSSALLRGSLVRCGPGVRGVGWPETPSVRLAALAPWLTGKRVATHEAAAWVWGAARDPGSPLRVSSRSRGRTGSAEYTHVKIQETRFHDGDVVHHGPCAVTTPLRTIIDLLYDQSELDSKARIIVRLLVRTLPQQGREITYYFSQNRRPFRTRAITRWSHIYPEIASAKLQCKTN